MTMLAKDRSNVTDRPTELITWREEFRYETAASQQPSSEDDNKEAVEYPLLEAVTTQRLVKT
jgi:hypothetical protein